MKDYNDPKEVPGMSEADSKVMRFHTCLDEMLEKYRDQKDDELYAIAVLEGLADGCNQMGLSQEFASRMASFRYEFSKISPDVVKTVFHTAYLKNYLKTVPLKYMKKSASLTFKVEAYMREHYEFRLNVMTNSPEYRQLGGLYSFGELDDKTRKTMTINALKAGVDSWDKDLDRYLESSLIPTYEPLADYLRELPRWDGKDRIEALAKRIKTGNRYWHVYFHKWMLSMVAQWLNVNQQHGNAIVPILIGPQGSGKTTFCRRLLPEELQRYYNDNLPMKKESEIYESMSSMALINIDEFDSITDAKHPVLKYLLSKHDVKMRPPYGKSIKQRRRFASFIATTNNAHPLTDPTGSRRFVCAYAETIDNTGKLNYNQIYAQLKSELNRGEQYWFTNKENARIMKSNEEFQKVRDFPTMIANTFLPVKDTPENAPYMLLVDIMDMLASKYVEVKKTNSAITMLGKLLSSMGYERKKISKGSSYKIISL